MPEQRREPHGEGSNKIESMPVADLLALMLAGEVASVTAIRRALPDIGRAVADAIDAIRSGGRVHYAGAGSSGRLGVLDASEIPPTFSSDRFRAHIAGGPGAIQHAVEGAEDDEGAGAAEGSALGPGDMAVGITASGRTPYVLGFLRAAHARGARSWLLTCATVEPYPFTCGMISLNTGAELIAGSTRLKAGTATKIVLNMISTAAMVRLGGVHEGLMVDVAPTNAKLVARALGIIRKITGCTEQEAEDSLRASGMRPKLAALMRVKGLNKDEAEELLKRAEGSLGKALS